MLFLFLEVGLYCYKLISSVQFSSVTQSCPTLRLQELQHARPPCPSPTPRAYPNPCPFSWWCHPTISSSVIPSPPALNLSSIRVFPNESTLRIRWPMYWSFSFNISPSNEHLGLISFRMDWFDLHAVQGTLKRVFSNTTVQKHQFFHFLYGPTLTSIHDHWKNHSLG